MREKERLSLSSFSPSSSSSSSSSSSGSSKFVYSPLTLRQKDGWIDVRYLPITFVVERDRTVYAVLVVLFLNWYMIFCAWHIVHNIHEYALQAGMPKKVWEILKPELQTVFETTTDKKM
jgi:hypothetical protein